MGIERDAGFQQDLEILETTRVIVIFVNCREDSCAKIIGWSIYTQSYSHLQLLYDFMRLLCSYMRMS